ncbi:C4-dicarboxylate ABC transporter permease [Primorskyibacter flagellatus]|uniref:TRAP transporter small permease protein n=1 Tax=Primorskyibacter flagellatus TaxID=1387277 RepID=A0A917ADE4_9RHOB|nr:TRAP transporter small permease [Primorskyibacter flagellatus]GGE44736.1 C4-dicarboxylate ABC transporter permease [Primorskyibacter flagellatus]
MAAPGEPQLPLNAPSAWLARVETVLVALSAIALAGIMCTVMLDVVLRYVFHAPLVWSYDLIGLYLVGAVFFFALSDTMQQHGHIALDVFVPLIPFRLRHAAQSAGFAASTLLLAAITWLEYGQAVQALVADNRIAGIVPFQTWVAHAVLALGMGVLVLRCAYRTLFHALSAVTGRDMVELPPPPVTSTAGLESAE